MKNNKSLGQHWLKDRPTLETIADLAAASPAHSPVATLPTSSSTIAPSNPAPSPTPHSPSPTPPTCLEIGPGLGTLTSSLLRRFPRVIAVEFDQRLAQNLPASFPGKNLQVIHQDFLRFPLASLPTPYVVAGNIPYYITSPIILKLLGLDHSSPSPTTPPSSPSNTPIKASPTSSPLKTQPPTPIKTTTPPLPTRIVLLIQKEVADRIVATPGHHTVLSLTVQNSATATLGPFVPRTLFTPPPKVDSQVLILDPKPTPDIPLSTFSLIKRGFSAPRKKLIANLPGDKTSLKSLLTRLHLHPDARPAGLTLTDWQNLATALK